MCLIASAFGGPFAAHASDIMIMSPYATASVTPKARTGAVYLTLMNHGAEADRLVSITSAAAEAAEIHETTNENNVMKMRSVEGLVIAPGATVDMKAAGLHIMLVGLKAPLLAGEKVVLELQFEKAGIVKVEADIGAASAGDHDHMDQ